MSPRSTSKPASARHAARLTAVVVLPTPPFWLVTAMTRVTGLLSRGTDTSRWGGGGSPAQPGRLDCLVEKGALPSRRVEQGQLGGGQRHGQRDAGDAGAGIPL